MSYQIGEVHYQNFGPFEDVAFDFSQPGLTVIEGQIDGKQGCDSNGCLSGSTLIDMPRDLQKHPKGVPLRSLVGKKPWVYSRSHAEQRIVVRRAARVWKTKRARTVTVMVTPYATARGSGLKRTYVPPLKLRGTPDHLVLLSDCFTWKPLGELVAGDSVCSMYRQWSGTGSRFKIYWTGLASANAVSEQQFLCEALHGERPEGHDVHHVDGNYFNNDVGNLAWVDSRLHISAHTTERNLKKEAGWQKTGVHPQGMLGKKHTMETRRRIAEACKGKGRPRNGSDRVCATCGVNFYASKASTRKYCSLDCCYEHTPVNHTVLSVEDSGVIDVYDMEVPGTNNFIANGMVVHNSGKSFLFDGVAWALFGRCIRERYSGDDIVRLGTKGNTCVCVNLVGDADTVSVTRYRKHSEYKNNVYVAVNGEDVSRGTNPQTTELIESIIGMDYTTFANSVAFGAREDIKSFFAAPDSERKRILETILGLGLYTDAEKVARLHLKEITSQITEQDEKEVKLVAALEEIGVTKQSMSGMEEDEEDEALSLQLRLLQIRFARVEVKRLKKKGALEAERVRILDERYDSAMEKYEREKAKYTAIIDEAGKHYNEACSVKSGLEADVRTLEGRVQKTKQLKGTCETCFQAITKVKKNAVLKTFTDEIQQKISKLNAAAMDADRYQQTIDATELPESPSMQELNDATAALTLLGTERKHMETHVSLSQSALDEAAAAHAEQQDVINELEERRVKAEQDMEEGQEAKAELQGESDLYEFWVEGFGNSGLKSFLIEAEIPEVNSRASSYAQRLLGEGALVKLCATKKLKTKDVKREELTVEGSIPGCTKSYAGASKGQKRRMDLSLILAFREIVASRSAKPFRQLFADEIFDGMDKSGVACIAELLRELSEDIPVALVTHDSKLKLVGDRIICLHHDGSCAKITGGTQKRIKKPKKKGKG